MKNAFYFMLKAVFVLEIFTLFVYVEKRLDKKADVNFKIYDVIDWVTNNYNIYFSISKEVKATRNGNFVG